MSSISISLQPSSFVVEVPSSLPLEHHEQFIENSLRAALKDRGHIPNGPVESSIERTGNWVLSQDYGDAKVLGCYQFDPVNIYIIRFAYVYLKEQ